MKILKIKTKKRSNAKMDVNDLRVMDAADGILYLLHYFESNILSNMGLVSFLAW